MGNSSDNKVLGIEIAQYTKICYILILIASGYGVITNILGLAAIYVPGGMATGVLGIAGVVLALLGLFVFKDKFSALDISHFTFIGIMFAAFFFIYAIVVNQLVKFGFVGLLFVIAISVLQFVLFYAGFKARKAGVEASKDTIQSNLKTLLKK